MSANNQETLKLAAPGVIASALTWLVGAFKWYGGHLHQITDVLINLAQIGGLIVILLTIRKLWREGKTRKKDLD